MEFLIGCIFRTNWPEASKLGVDDYPVIVGENQESAVAIQAKVCFSEQGHRQPCNRASGTRPEILGYGLDRGG